MSKSAPTTTATAKPQQNRMQLAMEMVLKLVGTRLGHARAALMDESRQSGDRYMRPLNLVEIAIAETGRMQVQAHDDFDEFAVALTMVDTLCRAAVTMYGDDQDGPSLWAIKAAANVEALFELVELQEGLARSAHHEG